MDSFLHLVHVFLFLYICHFELIDILYFHSSAVGGRAFPVAEAKVWDIVPADVTSASSLPDFNNRLNLLILPLL